MPIDVILEKHCLKFIWSCINSNNTIVKSVSSSAIMYSYSSLGENYRFLSDKYDIWPIYLFYLHHTHNNGIHLHTLYKQ